MTIRFANPADIEQWMQLVRKVKDNFPGLETEEALTEHQKTVLSFIQKGGAVCGEADGSRSEGFSSFPKEGASSVFWRSTLTAGDSILPGKWSG